MINRFVVVVAAYLFSWLGLFFVLAILSSELQSQRMFMPVVWIWAVMVLVQLFSQVSMGFGWILDLRLGRGWVIAASISTVFAWALYPLLHALRSDSLIAGLYSALLFWAYGAVFLAPYWALWFVLFRFHRSSDPALPEVVLT